MRLFVGLLALSILTPTLSAQTWVPDGSGDITSNYTGVFVASGMAPSGPYTWTHGQGNYFRVTGSSSSSPPWSLRYAALCNNQWVYSETWSHTFGPNTWIDIYHDYYIREGWERFKNGSQTERRDAYELVSSDLWWLPRSGGGS